MSEQSRTTLKGYFKVGDVPSQTNFEDLIDSNPNISDDYAEQNVMVEISSAEMLTLYDSSIELIPAPGVGKMVFIHQILVHYHYGTIPYVSSYPVIVYNNDDNDPVNSSFNINLGSTSLDFIRDSFTNRSTTGAYYEDIETYDNKSILLYKSSPNPTSGDGTLTVNLWYRIIPIV